MAGLADLAYGLRQAAGVLNPSISAANEAQDARREEMATQAAIARQNAAYQFALQQATPQAALQRQQLENEVGFRRAMAEAGGDEEKITAAAMQFGKPEIAVSLINQKEQRAARLQQAKDALEVKREALAQQERLTLERLSDARDKATAEQEFKRQRLMLDGQIAQMRAGQMETANQLRLMQIQAMGDKNEREKAQAAQKQTIALGTAFEKAGLPTMNAVVNDAIKAVSDDKVLSYVNGPKSSVPDLLVNKDVTDARQAISKLFNITLKDRSGAAVTIQELERLKDEFGKGVFKTPEQLRQAVDKAAEIVDSHYRGIAAGFGKGTLESYNQNLKDVGGDAVLSGRKRAGGPPPPPPGFK